MGCYLEDSVWSRGSWFLGEVCLSAHLSDLGFILGQQGAMEDV